MFRRLFIVFMMVILSSVSSYGVWDIVLDFGKDLLVGKGQDELKESPFFSFFYTEEKPEDVAKDLKLNIVYEKESPYLLKYHQPNETSFNRSIDDAFFQRRQDYQLDQVNKFQSEIKQDLATMEMQKTVLETERLKKEIVIENLQQQSNHYMGQLTAEVKNKFNEERSDKQDYNDALQQLESEWKRQVVESNTHIKSLQFSGSVNGKTLKEKSPVTIDLESTLTSLNSVFDINSRLVTTYLLLLCFIVSCIWRYVEMVSSDSEKVFPVLNLIGQLFFVILAINIADTVFTFIINVTNGISVAIYKEMLSPLERFGVSSQDIETLEKSTFISIKSIMHFVGKANFIIADFILGVLQQFLLGLMFLFSPYIFVLSLLPIFGFKLIVNYMKTFIQIAFWSVLKSCLYLMFTTLIVSHVQSILNRETIAWQFLLYSIVALVSAVYIPKIASLFIGGGDFSALSVAANLLAQNKSMTDQVSGNKAGSQSLALSAESKGFTLPNK